MNTAEPQKVPSREIQNRVGVSRSKTEDINQNLAFLEETSNIYKCTCSTVIFLASATATRVSDCDAHTDEREKTWTKGHFFFCKKLEVSIKCHSREIYAKMSVRIWIPAVPRAVAVSQAMI